MLIKKLCIFLTVFLWSLGVFSAEPPSFTQLQQWHDEERWETLVKTLRPLMDSIQDSEYNKWGWWLLGKSYRELRQHGQAEYSFRQGLQKTPKYADLWEYQLLKTALSANQKKQALEWMDALLQHKDLSFYLPEIQELIKEHYVSDKEILLLYPFFDKHLAKPQWFLQDHDLIALYIRGAEAQGFEVKRWIYLQQWQYPRSLKGAKETEARIVEWERKQVIRLKDEAYLSRFQQLKKQHLYSYIRETLPTHMIYVENPAIRRKLGKIYAHALYSKKYFSQIIQLHQQGVFERTYNLTKGNQWYWVTRSHQRLKNQKAAEESIQKLTRHAPNSFWLRSSYANMALMYRGLQKGEKADRWWRLILERFPDSKEAKEAHWEVAWYRIQQKRYSDALYYLTNGFEKLSLSLERNAQFLYWKGYVEYQLNRPEAAEQSFATLQRGYPSTYYGLRWTSEAGKLQQFIQKDIGYKEYWHDSPPKLNQKMKPIFRHYHFLFTMGEAKQAAHEVKTRIDQQKNHSVIWAGSRLLYDHEQYDILQQVVGSYFYRATKKRPVGHQEVWKFAYPRTHWNTVQQLSQKSKIDPYLALSIMREESRFDEKALSRTRAKGLMQLMPQTAQDVSKRYKIELVGAEPLFEPDINIGLGVSYLGGLFRQFDGNFIHMTGSYNAGPGNMKRWMRRWEELPPTYFIERIPYEETQKYVKRVFTSYQLYRQIYDNHPTVNR